MSANLQIGEDGRLRHFLSIEGMNRTLLTEILDTAESFAGVTEQSVKKVPLLRGRTIVNLFFEVSTRTRTTFELAAKRLSADVLNINVNASSAVKGETLLDTLRNLQAMHVDMFVVRHADSGTAHFSHPKHLGGVSNRHQTRDDRQCGTGPLGTGHEVGVGLIIEPTPVFDELTTEIAEMSDRAAK